MIRTARLIGVSLSVGLAGLLALPPGSWAEWSAIAEQRTSYTTDAFQFSSARRLRFSEDPSQPTVVPVEKPEDVIWEPSLDVKQTTSTPWGTNELSVKAHGFLYTNHTIFTHGDYRIQDRLSVNDRTSVLLRYRYLPNLFLGPNFERRSGARLIQEERVSSHHVRGELDHRLTEDMQVALIGRYGFRSYNEAFAERDTHFYTIGPRLEYRVNDSVTIRGVYLYERGLADGRHETQFSDDISYRLHLLTVGTDLRLTPRLSIDLAYTHLRKAFTSDLAGDTHFGRHDFTHQGVAELHYAVSSAMTATLGFQRTQRSSTNQLRDFNDTIVSLGVQYRF